VESEHVRGYRQQQQLLNRASLSIIAQTREDGREGALISKDGREGRRSQRMGGREGALQGWEGGKALLLGQRDCGMVDLVDDGPVEGHLFLVKLALVVILIPQIGVDLRGIGVCVDRGGQPGVCGDHVS